MRRGEAERIFALICTSCGNSYIIQSLQSTIFSPVSLFTELWKALNFLIFFSHTATTISFDIEIRLNMCSKFSRFERIHFYERVIFFSFFFFFFSFFLFSFRFFLLNLMWIFHTWTLLHHVRYTRLLLIHFFRPLFVRLFSVILLKFLCTTNLRFIKRSVCEELVWIWRPSADLKAKSLR